MVEVKSLLDSYGVWYEAVVGKDSNKEANDRYKLFNNSKFRKIITQRLGEEYLKQGLINRHTEFNFALAAGNIHSAADELKISKYFTKRGWKLFLPKHIKEKMRQLSEKGYEDDVLTIAAKLTLRD